MAPTRRGQRAQVTGFTRTLSSPVVRRFVKHHMRAAHVRENGQLVRYLRLETSLDSHEWVKMPISSTNLRPSHYGQPERGTHLGGHRASLFLGPRAYDPPPTTLAPARGGST